MTGLKVETPVSFAPSQNDRGPVALSIELVVNDALLDMPFKRHSESWVMSQCASAGQHMALLLLKGVVMACCARRISVIQRLGI
jgi:hypothetical protein